MSSGRDDPAQLDADEFARWWKETGEHELRQILLWRWDPIGVSDHFPNTADEYDGYAPGIVAGLRNAAAAEEIEALLLVAEQNAMGLSAQPHPLRRETADLIVFWFENSQDSWKEFGPVRR